MEMLCLAVSWKRGGLCVAGIGPDGSWVRPVGAADGLGLSSSRCMLDVGRRVALLDVVDIGAGRPTPLPHQRENVLTPLSHHWRLTERLSGAAAAATLDGLALRSGRLFGTSRNRVRVADHQGRDSLALVKARSPEFWLKPRDGRVDQLRCRFELGENEYDLPVTDVDADAQALAAMRRGDSSNDWYLTVSLGEAWSPDNTTEDYHFLLVAGVIQVPHV